MYRVLIIEDDSRSAEHARALVLEHALAKSLDVSVADPASLESRLAMGPAPHIALVDISLGADPQGGIEVVRRHFPEGSSTQVIYITGYIEYCTDVYQTDHVSFLVKPLKPEQLNQALDKALRNLDRVRQETLAVRNGGATRMLPAGDIEFIESRKRKLSIHVDDEELQTYATLSGAEGRLPAYFLRCHKSYLVNMHRVVEVRGDELTLASGAVVPVSRTYRREVKERFSRFLSGTIG